MRRRGALRGAQVEHLQALSAARHQGQLRRNHLVQVLDRRAAALGRLRLARCGEIRACEVPGLLHGQHVALPLPHGRTVHVRSRVQPVLRVWQLVPGREAPHAAGHGQAHQRHPRHVRAARAHPQGPAAVQLGAHGALPVLAELHRAVLQPDHLVRGRHQRVPRNHAQDIRGQPGDQAHQRRDLHLQPPHRPALPEDHPHLRVGGPEAPGAAG
mmetsp:Transcript_22146/g.49256  ORF Transcript_22146/g.49256 Transcript_22146/m.49256 type:complete len:213 (-) Transcript_22146:1658-2296(-)